MLPMVMPSWAIRSWPWSYRYSCGKEESYFYFCELCHTICQHSVPICQQDV
jgi:hypothetical protein